MKLFYRKYGAGKPLFILHGLFGQSDNWQGPAKVIAEWGFEVYCIDLRNHGQSPHDNTFNYPAMAQDIIELADELNLPKFSVMGHSMGGKVAFQMVQLCPSRLLSLVVVDIGIKFYPPHHQDVIEAISRVDFEKCKNRSAVQNILNQYLPDLSMQQFLLKNIYWSTPEQLAWRFNFQAIAQNIEEVGEEIFISKVFTRKDFEVLLIRGQYSSYILDEDIPGIQAHFPDLELETIQAAGHWVHADQPQNFLSVLHKYLNLWQMRTASQSI